MLEDVPLLGVILIDSIAWGALHMGMAWGGTQLPQAWFLPDHWCFRPRAWESGGTVYERWFRVRAWKHLLPDGAAWFRGGFRKGGLDDRTPAYFRQFIRETCRGEAVHWGVLLSGGLFFLWNPWWLGICMVLYAVAANVPCIVVQRYNRIRLTQVISRRKRAQSPQNESIGRI